MVRVRPHPGSSYPHGYSWPGLVVEEAKWERFPVERNTFIPWQIPQIRYEQSNPLCFSSNFLTSDSHQDNEAGESLNFLKRLQLGTSVPGPESSQLWQRNNQLSWQFFHKLHFKNVSVSFCVRCLCSFDIWMHPNSTVTQKCIRFIAEWQRGIDVAKWENADGYTR